jgi:hypothetical protein
MKIYFKISTKNLVKAIYVNLILINSWKMDYFKEESIPKLTVIKNV